MEDYGPHLGKRIYMEGLLWPEASRVQDFTRRVNMDKRHKERPVHTYHGIILHQRKIPVEQGIELGSLAQMTTALPLSQAYVRKIK